MCGGEYLAVVVEAVRTRRRVVVRALVKLVVAVGAVRVVRVLTKAVRRLQNARRKDGGKPFTRCRRTRPRCSVAAGGCERDAGARRAVKLMREKLASMSFSGPSVTTVLRDGRREEQK